MSIGVGETMKASVQRVCDALVAADFQPRIVQFTETTRTASDAAAAIGTTVPRIVKSLVFLADGQPLVVLTSGTNRVDTAQLGDALGKTIARANAEQVRAATGFAVGGVAPLGYPTRLDVILDRDLLQHDEVWAAAGTPNDVFAISPTELVRVTAARVLDVKESASARWYNPADTAEPVS